MSNRKEEYALERKQKLNTLIYNLKESYGKVDPKLVDFLDKLNVLGFFLNLTDFDIDFALEDVIKPNLPIVTNGKISIGIDNIYASQVRIGIDPSYCFNKTGDCSIIAYFPMSKREYNRFIKLFDKLINTKINNANYWFKVARESWCGEYAMFGR